MILFYIYTYNIYILSSNKKNSLAILSTISATELALFVSQRPYILRLAIDLNKNNNVASTNFNNNISMNSINLETFEGTIEVCIISWIFNVFILKFFIFNL